MKRLTFVWNVRRHNDDGSHTDVFHVFGNGGNTTERFAEAIDGLPNDDTHMMPQAREALRQRYPDTPVHWW